MFLKLVNIGLLILFNSASVLATEFEFDITDANQPFVINIEYDPEKTGNERTYKLNARLPFSCDDTKVKYTSKFNTYSNLLISACPLANKNQDYSEILLQNQQNEITCAAAFQPSVHKNNDKMYGAMKDGVKYSVGYWVYWIEPTPENKLSTEPTFISLYEIFHSSYEGLLYTLHEICPGSGMTLENWVKYKGNNIFKSNLINYRIYPDLSQMQLVPFEDFVPMPGKIATLLDINLVYVDSSIKNGFNIINAFLRQYVNITNIQLSVYSGVKSDAWHWKIIKKDQKGVLISIHNHSEQFSPPCDAGGCKKFGLVKLERQIANLYCCQITKWIVETLNLVTFTPDYIPIHLNLSEKLVFSQTT